MDEDKKLYPFRFRPLEDSYAWGTEVFKLADLGYRDTSVRNGWLSGNSISEIMDMYMDRVVGDEVFERFGRQFPLQVKYLKVGGRMPLRVHPGDEAAAQRFDFLGKDKLWYIVSAEPGAKVLSAFNEESDAGRYWQACEDGSLPQLLTSEEALAGDAFLIPAGRIHGAEGKMVIAEISESSPLDFCAYAWGEPLSEEEFDPALPLVDALDLIDYSRCEGLKLTHGHGKSGSSGAGAGFEGDVLAERPQFTVRRFSLLNPLHIWAENASGFAIYLCCSGEASLKEKDSQEQVLGAGELLLVPSECPDITLTARRRGTVVLEASVDPLPEKDPYINPDVPEKLPEDE